MAYETLPIPVQTLYAEMVERAWTGEIGNLIAGGGSPYAREIKGRKYWYWQPPTENGRRPPARYIGPDGEETRRRLGALADRAETLRQRREAISTWDSSTPSPWPSRIGSTVISNRF